MNVKEPTNRTNEENIAPIMRTITTPVFLHTQGHEFASLHAHQHGRSTSDSRTESRQRSEMAFRARHRSRSSETRACAKRKCAANVWIPEP
jgi:hypothetical protein